MEVGDVFLALVTVMDASRCSRMTKSATIPALQEQSWRFFHRHRKSFSFRQSHLLDLRH